MKRSISYILISILPLTAIIIAVVTIYAWYPVLYPDIEKTPVSVQSKISPVEFSAGIQASLENILDEKNIELSHISSRIPDIDDTIQRIYTVMIPSHSSLADYHLQLSRIIDERGGGIMRTMESSNGRTLSLTLGVGNVPTDVVIFRKNADITEHKARMAVIVDDLGIKTVGLAKRLCNIGYPVTLAILPFQHHSEEVEALAKKTDTSYMLHMPMEPQSKAVNPGEGAIYANDSKDVIYQKLSRAYASVNGATGMNNHMGSRVTENPRVMATIMGFLGDRDYFFIDSRTSNATVGYELSRQHGIKGAIMNGYLDVQDDETHIALRFEAMAAYARKTGTAIVICHDRPNTVAVLERMMPELADSGIAFVRVQDVIR